MTKPNPPPRRCLLLELLDLRGEDTTRRMLNDSPALRGLIRDQAQSCEDCQTALSQLFPSGLPETADNPEEAERLRGELEKQLSHQEARAQPGGT